MATFNGEPYPGYFKDININSEGQIETQTQTLDIGKILTPGVYMKPENLMTVNVDTPYEEYFSLCGVPNCSICKEFSQPNENLKYDGTFKFPNYPVFPPTYVSNGQFSPGLKISDFPATINFSVGNDITAESLTEDLEETPDFSDAYSVTDKIFNIIEETDLENNYRAAYYDIYMMVENIIEKNERLEDEVEQLRVQLAGCGAAALGYAGECKQGDYGWSASLGDVQDLYEKYNNLKSDCEYLNNYDQKSILKDILETPIKFGIAPKGYDSKYKYGVYGDYEESLQLHADAIKASRMISPGVSVQEVDTTTNPFDSLSGYQNIFLEECSRLEYENINREIFTTTKNAMPDSFQNTLNVDKFFKDMEDKGLISPKVSESTIRGYNYDTVIVDECNYPWHSNKIEEIIAPFRFEFNDEQTQKSVTETINKWTSALAKNDHLNYSIVSSDYSEKDKMVNMTVKFLPVQLDEIIKSQKQYKESKRDWNDEIPSIEVSFNEVTDGSIKDVVDTWADQIKDLEDERVMNHIGGISTITTEIPEDMTIQDYFPTANLNDPVK